MKHLAPLLLLLTMAAHAQTPAPHYYHETWDGNDKIIGAISYVNPPAPHIDFAKWSLLTADATMRGLDAYSTQRAARCGCNHEQVLPDFISKHGARLWAYQTLVPAFNYQAAQFLDRRGHHRLSRLVYAVDISLELPAVIGNMQLRDKMPKGMISRRVTK